jgi:hypothetical protein
MCRYSENVVALHFKMNYPIDQQAIILLEIAGDFRVDW